MVSAAFSFAVVITVIVWAVKYAMFVKAAVAVAVAQLKKQRLPSLALTEERRGPCAENLPPQSSSNPSFAIHSTQHTCEQFL